MKLLLPFVALAFSCGGALAADAEVIYQYGKGGKVLGVNALVSIEDAHTGPGDNCDQRIADLVVDEVTYENNSDMISGFRAKKPGVNSWYGLFTIESSAAYKQVPNAARHDIGKLVNKGAELIVVYQVCGSGGFSSVRDIFKKSAINNP